MIRRLRQVPWKELHWLLLGCIIELAISPWLNRVQGSDAPPIIRTGRKGSKIVLATKHLLRKESMIDESLDSP